MVCRLLLRMASPQHWTEFYPVVKRATQFELTLSLNHDGLVSLDPKNPKGQPWDGWPWHGNSPYLAGLWLCSLQIARHMAGEGVRYGLHKRM